MIKEFSISYTQDILVILAQPQRMIEQNAENFSQFCKAAVWLRPTHTEKRSFLENIWKVFSYFGILNYGKNSYGLKT